MNLDSQNRPLSHSGRCFSASAILISLSGMAGAATLYWDGAATTVDSQSSNATTTAQNWLSGGNWDNGTTSAGVASWNAGDDAVFGGTAVSQAVTAGTLTVGALTFGQGGSATGTSGTAYTVTGGTITLSSSTITANTNATVGSILAGTTGMTKAGPAKLTLTGVNTYTGGTIIDAGTLQIGTSTLNPTVGAGTYTINGSSTLRIEYATTTAASTSLGTLPWGNFSSSGSGTLNIASNGINDYIGNDAALPASFTGTLRIDGGRVHTPASGGLGGTTRVIVNSTGQFGMWNGGTTFGTGVSFELAGIGYGETGFESALRMSNGGGTSTINGPVTLTGNATIGANGTGVINGAISGTGFNLTIGTTSLNGTMVLAGTNTYTGTTTVNNGTLRFPLAASFYNSTAGSVSGVNAAKLIVNTGATASFNVGGTGEFNTADIVTLLGASTASAGFKTGSNLGMDTTNAVGTYPWPTALANPNGGANVMGLAKSGTGTLSLSATNTYTGATIISAGTLELTGSGSLNSGNYAGAITNNGALSYSSSTNQILSGGMGGAGSLALATGAGSLTLSGAVTYTGSTTVDAGRVIFKSTGALATSIANNATVEINAATGDDWILTAGKTLSGPGTWVKTGAGRASIPGAILTTSGAFQIQQGSLRNNNNTSNWSGSTADIDISTGAILDLYADEIHVDQLTGTGIVQNNFGYDIGHSGVARFTERLVVGVADGSSTFDGIIRNNATNAILALGDGRGGVQLEKTGSGLFKLTGANSYTGVTKITGGTLSVATIGVAGVPSNLGAAPVDALNLQFDGGTLLYTGANASTDRGYTITADKTATIEIQNAASNLTISGASAATSGSVNKTGDGTLTLAGTNTYSGTTTVNAGKLVLDRSGSLPSSDTTLKSATTLQIDAAGKTLKTLAVEGNTSLNLAAEPGATTTITGDLAFTDTPNITVRPIMSGLVSAGSLDLLTAASISGTPGTITTDFTIHGPSRVTGSTAVVDRYLVLTVDTGSADLTWAGGTGKWNLNADANFTGADGKFLAYDSVTFGDTGAGTVTLEGTLAPGTLTVDSSSDYTFSGSGSVVGTVGLTKFGTGKLTVTANNAYTGVTTLSGGTLSVDTISNGSVPGTLGAASAAAANLVLDEGTLQYTGATASTNRGFTIPSSRIATIEVSNAASNLTITGAVPSTTGELVKTGPGTLTLSGANSYGSSTVSAGTLIADLTAKGAGQFRPGNFSVAAGTTLTLRNTRAPGIDPGSVLVGSILTGSGTVTQDGTGYIDWWEGCNISGFTGNYNVLSGSVGFQGNTPASMTNTATYNMSAGTTFDARTADPVVGMINGAGEISNSWRNTRTVTVGNGGASGSFSGIIRNRATMPNNGDTTGAIAITKMGAGTWTLSGANTYTGATNITGGTLTLGSGGTLANTGAITVASGATLKLSGANNQLQASATTPTLTVNGTVEVTSLSANTLYATTILLNNGTLTSSGGAGASATDGGAGQYGAYYFHGSKTITATGTSNTISGNGGMGIGGGYVLTLNTPSVADSCVISTTLGKGNTGTAGALTKTGAGVVTLTGTSGYSGVTTISAGTLLVNGTQSGAGAVTVATTATLGGTGSVAGAVTIQSGGTLAPGAGAGTLTFGSTVNAQAGSTYAAEIASASSHDKVVTTGTLTLAGNIKVTLLGGYVPASGATFDLADATSITGTPTFDFTAAALPGGLSWDTTSFASNGTIKVVGGSDPFGSWATVNNVTEGKAGDDDKDGISNLLEFATAADPKSGSSVARVYPLVHQIGGQRVLTYTTAVRAAATFAPNGAKQQSDKDGVRYVVEASDTLGNWDSVVVTELAPGNATSVQAALGAKLDGLNAAWQWHTFRTDGDLASDPSDFIRLNVTETP